MAHFILTYRIADDYAERRTAYRQAHLAYAWAAAERGELLLGGAVGDPPSGAMLLFTDGQAAEEFARADPYVAAGIVTGWEVKPWITVVGEDAANPVQ
ncbi:MAG: YciI-like protein [Sphingobium sp.]